MQTLKQSLSRPYKLVEAQMFLRPTQSMGFQAHYTIALPMVCFIFFAFDYVYFFPRKYLSRPDVYFHVFTLEYLQIHLS